MLKNCNRKLVLSGVNLTVAIPIRNTRYENQLTEFREIFTLFDKDKSGFISGKELSTCLKCLGQDPEEDEIREIIHSLDING